MFKVIISKAGNRYIYESLTNQFFAMDNDSFSRLPGNEGQTKELHSIGEDFWNSYFSTCTFEEQDILISNETSSPDTCPELLVLEVTQQCNFRCKYCIYSGTYKYERLHSSINMEPSYADTIIDRYFSNDKCPGYVSFYGGEPLMNFSLIRYVVNRITEKKRQPVYTLTTNGIFLLDDYILDYLVQNAFNINISYDGVNHDKYRKTVNGIATRETVYSVIKKIYDMYPEFAKDHLSISVTLAPPCDWAANAIHFNEDPILSNLRIMVNLVNNTDTSFFTDYETNDQVETYHSEFQMLMDEYIDSSIPLPFHEGIFDQTFRMIDERDSVFGLYQYPPGFCTPFQHRIFITADGKIRMCERVGEYGEEHQFERVSDQYNKVTGDMHALAKQKCHSCICNRLCGLCYSSFRRGNSMGDNLYIKKTCDEYRIWFERMLYMYVSKKEVSG